VQPIVGAELGAGSLFPPRSGVRSWSEGPVGRRFYGSCLKGFVVDLERAISRPRNTGTKDPHPLTSVTSLHENRGPLFLEQHGTRKIRPVCGCFAFRPTDVNVFGPLVEALGLVSALPPSLPSLWHHDRSLPGPVSKDNVTHRAGAPRPDRPADTRRLIINLSFGLETSSDLDMSVTTGSGFTEGPSRGPVIERKAGTNRMSSSFIVAPSFVRWKGPTRHG